MGELNDPPNSQVYPRVPPLVWVLVGIAFLVGAMVLVLTSGGPDAPSEQRGDLTYIEGRARPNRQQGDLVASIADVIEADVRREGDSLVFSARTAAALPQPLKISALQFRWDVSSEDGGTWTVTATVEKTTEATVFSSTGFGVGTVDDTLPGMVTVTKETIEVHVDVSQIPEFPKAFEWSLTTTLRAFRDEPDSPRVEDRYPDEGTERVDDWGSPDRGRRLTSAAKRERPERLPAGGPNVASLQNGSREQRNGEHQVASDHRLHQTRR